MGISRFLKVGSEGPRSAGPKSQAPYRKRMQLPYGIEEQYQLFHTFIRDPSTILLHIEVPYPETETILQVALQELDPDTYRVQYFESDSCFKKIITHKKSGHIKQFRINRPYEYTMVWKRFRKISLLDSVIYR